MKCFSGEEKIGILVDIAVLLFLPLAIAGVTIYWWLSIVTPSSSLEAIISALSLSVAGCIYCFIVFHEIMDGKTVILRLLYMKKKRSKKIG
ncbi:MAG: hypothetical protein P1P85_01020 [Patescibacteria group bacterium]|nr:hypothetical protein [Patescibacteria group bacterium]